MVTDNEKSPLQRLKDDKLLRREAGEGWHPHGLNDALLGAIAVREILMDQIISDDFKAKPHEDQVLDWEEYESQVAMVNEIKEQNGIHEPPPLEIDTLPEKES